MNRRDVIGFLLAVGGGGVVASCVPRGRSVAGRPAFAIPPVLVSEDRVTGMLVGLRPYRPSGFVLRSERLDGKHLIHNYGHGGGGLTLSWGVAHLAFERALESEQRQCAVLGCGVIGLSTGILLQRRGWEVTIYARDLPPDTTSNIAGGLWSPFSVYEEDRATPAFKEQFQRAARLAHQHFRSLVGPRYGVRWVESYQVADDPVRVPGFFEDLADLYPGTTLFGPGQHPFPHRYARRDLMIQIETPGYLAAIESDFRMAGGRVVQREFRGLADVGQLAEPVVVNCTGLGSRELFDDTELIPAKGQLIVLVPQPEVQYGFGMDDGSLYMMSRQDGVLLGGTFERDVWDLTPNLQEMERVLRGHGNVFSSLVP